MAKIEIFKHEQIDVFYLQEEKIIYHVMHCQAEGAPLRDALLAGTEALRKNKATKWLSDDRLNEMTKPEDLKWTQEVWQPKVIEAGWKYWAIIKPKSSIANMRMSFLASDYKKLGVTVDVFATPEEGLKWLKSF